MGTEIDELQEMMSFKKEESRKWGVRSRMRSYSENLDYSWAKQTWKEAASLELFAAFDTHMVHESCQLLNAFITDQKVHQKSKVKFPVIEIYVSSRAYYQQVFGHKNINDIRLISI